MIFSPSKIFKVFAQNIPIILFLYSLYYSQNGMMVIPEKRRGSL